MNERIQQLAEQAGFMDSWFSESGDDCEQELKKFAELIVKECLLIVEPTQHHQAFAQGYLGDVEGLELLDNKVKQIKQHFGVEE
jgi:hypothetical protein